MRSLRCVRLVALSAWLHYKQVDRHCAEVVAARWAERRESPQGCSALTARSAGSAGSASQDVPVPWLAVPGGLLGSPEVGAGTKLRASRGRAEAGQAVDVGTGAAPIVRAAADHPRCPREASRESNQENDWENREHNRENSSCSRASREPALTLPLSDSAACRSCGRWTARSCWAASHPLPAS